jgi:phosphoribosylglycinamide formyltransferase-1
MPDVSSERSGTAESKTVQKGSDPLVLLISGRGSNLAAILDAVDDGALRARVAVVISNKPDAAGLEHARRRGIDTLVLPHRDYPARADYDRALAAKLLDFQPKLVCLAGFMRMLGPAFFEAYPGTVLNVHPSLLPAFPGVNAQGQAFAHGVKLTGVTVHIVTPDLDDGPIVMQSAVAVEDDDTEETLTARILAEEHRLYPKAIDWMLTRPWRLDGRRLVFGDRRRR